MLEVVLVPALTDNYIALLRDATTGDVAIVDPGEDSQVVWCHQKLGWKNPSLILNTHHHADHVGGNERLQKKFGCDLIASKKDSSRVPGDVTQGVGEGDEVRIGSSVGKTIEIPGHTLGHVAFWFPESQIAFVGDTLFGIGCGRLFEGTAEQMFRSLQKLAALADSTKIYCGHEYTEANAKFALSVDPQNAELLLRSQATKELRSRGVATVPFEMGLEKKTNPFLRASTAAQFADLRRAKDNFSG